MAVRIERHFDLRVVQGGADAFVEASIATGIEPQDGVGFAITRVDVLREQGLGTTNSAIIEWSVCRDSKVAVAGYTDPECMLAWKAQTRNAANGIFIEDLLRQFEIPAGLVVVEPNIYVQLDSNATVLTNAVQFRFFYDEIKLTEVEILRLLNNV